MPLCFSQGWPIWEPSVHMGTGRAGMLLSKRFLRRQTPILEFFNSLERRMWRFLPGLKWLDFHFVFLKETISVFSPLSD